MAGTADQRALPPFSLRQLTNPHKWSSTSRDLRDNARFTGNIKDNDMQYPASKQEIRQAQFPHNLFVSGIFFFDLLMTPAVLGLKLGMAGLLVPLVCTCSLIGYIYLRSRRSGPWFIEAHWRLSFRNSQWLLIGYAISAVLILLGWLITLTLQDVNMKDILWTALTRVAVVPTVVALLATSVMEASAITMALRGIVPDRIAKDSPPPAQ